MSYFEIFQPLLFIEEQGSLEFYNISLKCENNPPFHKLVNDTKAVETTIPSIDPEYRSRLELRIKNNKGYPKSNASYLILLPQRQR